MRWHTHWAWIGLLALTLLACGESRRQVESKRALQEVDAAATEFDTAVAELTAAMLIDSQPLQAEVDAFRGAVRIAHTMTHHPADYPDGKLREHARLLGRRERTSPPAEPPYGIEASGPIWQRYIAARRQLNAKLVDFARTFDSA